LRLKIVDKIVNFGKKNLFGEGYTMTPKDCGLVNPF